MELLFEAAAAAELEGPAHPISIEEEDARQIDKTELRQVRLHQLLNKGTFQRFLKGMKSRSKYDGIIETFLIYHIEKGGPLDDTDMEENLLAYFETECDKKKEDGNRKYASTTLRSSTSVYVGYWLHTGRGDLHKLCPSIGSDLMKLDSKHTKKQAKVLNKEECAAILNLTATPETLLLKAWLVTSIAMAARGIESSSTEFPDIVRISSKTSEDMFKLSYRHAKDAEVKEAEPDYVFIIGVAEVRSLDEYIQCFDTEDRKGRFFRKLTYKGKTIKGTKQVIGHNTSAQY